MAPVVVSQNRNNGNAGEPSRYWRLGPSTGALLRDCMCKILQSSALLAFLNTITMGTAFPRVSPSKLHLNCTVYSPLVCTETRFSGRCCSCLERSIMPRHVCTVSATFLQSSFIRSYPDFLWYLRNAFNCFRFLLSYLLTYRQRSLSYITSYNMFPLHSARTELQFCIWS